MTGVILYDHERRRRIATSCVIDMVCQRWPAQAHLRDEGRRLDALHDAYLGAADEDERELLYDAACCCLENIRRLVDQISIERAGGLLPDIMIT